MDEKCSKIIKHTNMVLAARRSSKIGGGGAHKLTAVAARPAHGSICRTHFSSVGGDAIEIALLLCTLYAVLNHLGPQARPKRICKKRNVRNF